MKRNAIIALLCALFISLCSACGSDEPNNPNNTNSTEQDEPNVETHNWHLFITETWENTPSMIGSFDEARNKWYTDNMSYMTEQHNNASNTRTWNLYESGKTLDEVEAEINKILSWNWGKTIDGVWTYDVFYIRLTNLDDAEDNGKDYFNHVYPES